jgi:hypothetical protein
MGVDADVHGRLINIERLAPFPIHALYYTTYWTLHKFLGQRLALEKGKEDIRGNLSLA